MASRTQTGMIDADGHVLEVDTNLVDYFESPYRERFQDGAQLFQAINTVPLTPTDGWDRLLGSQLFRGKGNSAEEWLRALDEGGLACAAVYPTFGLFCALMRDPDYAVAFSRAYDEWLAREICEPAHGRILGVALLAPQDPDEAANELRRAVTTFGMRAGVLLADGGHLLGDRRYAPVYDTAAELGVPLSVHATGTHLGGNAPESFPKLIQAHTYSHPSSILRQFTSMMFSGIFEQYPTVRFAFLESGITWVPWWLDRMDEEFQLRGEAEAPLLTQPPSAYVREGGNIFFGIEANEKLLRPTLELIGSDIAMYASDWPHWDGDYPESLIELRQRPDLTAVQVERLTATSAARYYGLAVDGSAGTVTASHGRQPV